MSNDWGHLDLFDDPVTVERRVMTDWTERLSSAIALSGAAGESICWDILAEMREALGLELAEDARRARTEEHQRWLQEQQTRRENERRRQEQIERARQRLLVNPRVAAAGPPHFFERQEGE